MLHCIKYTQTKNIRTVPASSNSKSEHFPLQLESPAINVRLARLNLAGSETLCGSRRIILRRTLGITYHCIRWNLLHILYNTYTRVSLSSHYRRYNFVHNRSLFARYVSQRGRDEPRTYSKICFRVLTLFFFPQHQSRQGGTCNRTMVECWEGGTSWYLLRLKNCFRNSERSRLSRWCHFQILFPIWIPD